MNVGSLRLRRVEVCNKNGSRNRQLHKLIDWPKRSRTGVADWRSSEISFSFAIVFPPCSSIPFTSAALLGVEDTLRWLFNACASVGLGLETSWFRRWNCRSNWSWISVLSSIFGRLRDLYVTEGSEAVGFEFCWYNEISLWEVMYEAAAERAGLVGIFEIYAINLVLSIFDPLLQYLLSESEKERSHLVRFKTFLVHVCCFWSTLEFLEWFLAEYWRYCSLVEVCIQSNDVEVRSWWKKRDGARDWIVLWGPVD